MHERRRATGPGGSQRPRGARDGEGGRGERRRHRDADGTWAANQAAPVVAPANAATAATTTAGGSSSTAQRRAAHAVAATSAVIVMVVAAAAPVAPQVAEKAAARATLPTAQAVAIASNARVRPAAITICAVATLTMPATIAGHSSRVRPTAPGYRPPASAATKTGAAT